jgi:starch phosphorylase
MIHRHPIAYFSMEVAVDPAIPTYSGGLGVLAGDTLRSAADLGVPRFDGALHRAERVVLQHPPDAAAIRVEGVPRIGREEHPVRP